jgi:hypothetical protein
MTTTSRWIAIAPALLAGCGAVGAMRQAALFRECRPGDQGCKSTAPDAPLAVGARLRPAVEIEIAGSATPSVRVVSGRPDVVADDGGVLRGVKPGVAPVLITADDGSVIDFVHVWVAAPTRLAALAAPARSDAPDEVVAPIQLVVGESRWLEPAVFGGAQRLAGAGDIAWTLAPCQGSDQDRGPRDPDRDGAPCAGHAPVALLSDGDAQRRRLVARAPGKAHVALAGLGLTAAFDVEVVP